MDHHVGRTSEAAKRSSSRKWREQRRSSSNYCFSPAVLWPLILISCFVITGSQFSRSLSKEIGATSSVVAEVHSTALVHSFVKKDPDDRLTLSVERKWYSMFVVTEQNSLLVRKSEDEEFANGMGTAGNSQNVESSTDNHGLYNDGQSQSGMNDVVKSPVRLGFSVIAGRHGSSLPVDQSRSEIRWEPTLHVEESRDLSRAEGIEEDEDDSVVTQVTSRVDEDQDQMEEVEYSDDGAIFDPRNRTTKDDLLSDNGLLGAREAPKTCAKVEEMGSTAAGDTKMASLRLRRMIRAFFAEHGAKRVRELPPDLFCQRSFVIGKAQEDGFGNNIYKMLTAAGLGVILNRSLIIGESGSTNVGYVGKAGPLRFPFGNYVSYSEEVFSMREIKQLWAQNDCTGKYSRPLVMKEDSFDSPAHSSSLCEDWTKWNYPILWFKGTLDTNALQFLLKNVHSELRSATTMVLGDPSKPDSRPNAFGELMMAIVEPKPEVREAVEWALKLGSTRGPEPDIALHLRMRHSSSRAGPDAASACIQRIINDLRITNKRLRIVVVSDTPSVLAAVERSLRDSAEVITFDYKEFLSSSTDGSVSLRADSMLPPPKRRRDWGPMPRWVAVVDFFLAARAKHAVVSGAHRRVGTTYAQLLGALAAAYTLEEAGTEQQQAKFYSSFQDSLLLQGLVSQGGFGHSWRPFGGKLSCPKQPPQCALTPLLPYAWWDAPWQSPSNRDRVKMRQWGIDVESDGRVTEKSVQNFCRNRKKSVSEPILLALPKVRN